VCKTWEGMAVSSVIFWAFGFAAFGWLIFKIAERM
jgi:hypothetical protein